MENIVNCVKEKTKDAFLVFLERPTLLNLLVGIIWLPMVLAPVWTGYP